MNLGNTPTQPLLALAIVTYNRHDYLAELLESLRRQDFDDPFEVSVLDNGSETSCEAIVRDLAPTAVFQRTETNIVSWSRFQQAAQRTTARYILVPGDDDLLDPSFLSTMHQLASSSPSLGLLAASATTIDELGRPLGGRLDPKRFTSQAEALASLISECNYIMPASGFHRDILNVRGAPRTRASVDWWLWLQCWLIGPAAVADKAVVKYRQHLGQEQHHYGTDGKAMDAARMLLAFVASDRFRRAVDGWTAAERELFADTLLSGRGPSWGEPRWSAIIQAVLADVLADAGSSAAGSRLLAAGTPRAGLVTSVGALNTFEQSAAHLRLPVETWSATTLGWSSTPGCPLATMWCQYLGMEMVRSGQMTLKLDCQCSGRAHHASHVVRATLHSGDSSNVSMELAGPPDEATAAQLLEAIGELLGRPGAMSRPIGVEERAVALIRRIKRQRWANFAVYLMRRAGMRIS